MNRSTSQRVGVLVPLVIGGAGLLACALGFRHVPPSSAPPEDFESRSPSIDFATEVRPILSNNCFLCHGPDPTSREAGLRLDTPEGMFGATRKGESVVTPGDRESSLLWRRLVTYDADARMPPMETGKSLSAEEIETLGRWIDAGAPWAEHWSFEPVLDHPAPDVHDESWARADLDRFVLARLESEGIAPTPEADRATLLRRVTLDLVGLPPTPEQLDAFLADGAPDAYERVVDELLASPHFGERWARVWLDQARYADTKGYEKDSSRTIWPYRDWVIRAFNDDMPFDEFSVRQLAGDLLPHATPDDILATAFHRNTMTNDEGGTDDEEFRVAAVKDRVQTTFQVWNGLTMICAECHTHKYDPITQEEYYEVMAFFNQSADADRPDEAPTRAYGSPAQQAEIDRLEAEVAGLASRIERVVGERIAPGGEEELGSQRRGTPGPAASAALADPVDVYWIDDDTPPGITEMGDGSPHSWLWTATDEHPSAVGERSLSRTAPGDSFTQRYFDSAPIPLTVHEGDAIVVHVWLDEANPPREVMLQIHTTDGSWEHRAFWGENLIQFGATDTGARRPMGQLPASGSWVRLAIDPAEIDLAPGDQIDGAAFSQWGGTVRWDGLGLSTHHPPEVDWKHNFGSWLELTTRLDGRGLPDPLKAALVAEDRTPEQTDALHAHYVRHFHEPTRVATRSLANQIALAEAELSRARTGMVNVPVMAQLGPDAHRATHVLAGGNFLSKGDEVGPGVPAALHGFDESLPRDRLGFANWLVDERNPLVARVTVNRFWERFFGQGLVDTLEDFGAQGSLPSHPQLLDHLALTFMRDGWSMKALCRRIVLSSTYRQDSRVTPDRLERDPDNALFSRGPRFRVEAEMLRDQALAVSGLLSPKMFGPPVYPPQPEGVWQIVYSGERWMTSEGEDRYRRGLYTFWRRTAPYPSMMTFDASSREVCLPRRIRTNTPLQALVTLNDPVYVEAAQALARRMVREGGEIDESRARRGLRLCLVREPTDDEVRVVLDLVADARTHFADRPEEALAMATDPLGPLASDLDAAEAAAWTVAANVLLNLDEFLMRR